MISGKNLKLYSSMKAHFKKAFFFLFFTGLLGFISNSSNAQIALQYNDTTICPGNTISMCAALTGHASSLNTDDNFTGVLNIGFTFYFFGQPYTQCLISGNGMLSFNTSYSTQFAGWMWSQISTSGQANNAIFATFCDLYLPAGGVIRYQTYGSTGHRKFVVEWCNIPMYGCTSLNATTQLILFEGSNRIEVHTTHITPITNGCPAASFGYYQQVVQGVRNSSGTVAYYPTNRDPNPSATNWGVTGINDDGRAFIPVGGTPFVYKIDTIPYAPVAVIDSNEFNHLKWYDQNNLITPVAIGKCATVTPNGSQHYYLVNYTGYLSCQDTNVNLMDTVFINYGTRYDTINKAICEGENYNFLGKPLFKPGQYDTMFSSPMGCDSFITLNLTVNPLPDVSTKNSPNIDFCQGDSVRIGLDKPGAGNTYQWTKDGDVISGANQPTYMVHNAGMYVVNVTTNKGCQSSMNPITVTVHPNPTAQIAPLPNETICAYDTVQFSAVNPDAWSSYVWSPAKPFRSVIGNEGIEVKGVFLTSTEVKLTVYSRYGCSGKDSVYIKTQPCCEVFVPNAFSPNGDGINDYFKPHLQPGQVLTGMKIYNRLGQLVYNNDNISMGWNGKLEDGKAAASATYMYYIEYTCADGNLYHKKGSVTLVR